VTQSYTALSSACTWFRNSDSSIVVLMDSGYASILLNIEKEKHLKKRIDLCAMELS
jgi:hypothetical protein